MAVARTQLVAASLGAALGFAVGAAVGVRVAPGPPQAAPAAEQGRAPGDAPAPAAPADARMLELEAETARWREAYQQLARSMASDADSNQADEGDEADDVTEPETIGPSGPPPDAQARAAANFDEPSLISLGYTEDEARRLRERYEVYQLGLLYLNDLASREGWRQRPRFRAQSRHLAEALQADLGDRDYDAVLYAAGRSNRVRVAGVLAGSEAESAGVRDGDEIVSYDGRRIFDSQTIVRATTRGRAGASTELRIRRGDEELRFLLPRGPIGIALEAARVAPEGFR